MTLLALVAEVTLLLGAPHPDRASLFASTPDSEALRGQKKENTNFVHVDVPCLYADAHHDASTTSNPLPIYVIVCLRRCLCNVAHDRTSEPLPSGKLKS